MRPLPPSKTHGIIHTVTVEKGQKDAIAEQLQIPHNKRKWLEKGDKIHIVRAQREDTDPHPEIHTIREKRPGD
jgi:hypothetical protein